MVDLQEVCRLLIESAYTLGRRTSLYTVIQYIIRHRYRYKLFVGMHGPDIWLDNPALFLPVSLTAENLFQ
jgi:hypothetical protein